MRVMRTLALGAIGYGAYKAWKRHSAGNALTPPPGRTL